MEILIQILVHLFYFQCQLMTCSFLLIKPLVVSECMTNACRKLTQCTVWLFKLNKLFSKVVSYYLSVFSWLTKITTSICKCLKKNFSVTYISVTKCPFSQARGVTNNLQYIFGSFSFIFIAIFLYCFIYFIICLATGHILSSNMPC